MLKRLFSISAFFIALQLFQMSAYAESRWYNDQQVKSGGKLYQQNCASCHGKKAEGTKDWKKRDANGKLPPPPLDGTAHTWHHPLKVLRGTIRKGGAPVGGLMPAFKDKLSDEEMDSIIAWLQAKWPDEIYAAWSKRNGAITTGGKTAAAPGGSLAALILANSKPSPVKGIVQTSLGGKYVYATADGRYGFVGDLVDLKTGENLTEGLRKKDRLAQLDRIKLEDMVIIPAQGKEKTWITVFTDTSCAYCRKLHREVPQLSKAGVSVRYIAFPRGGKQGQGYKDLRSVWCSKDRAAAMSIAKGVSKGTLGSGSCKAADAVDEGYQFGINFGIRGTPAIVMPDGEFISGYRPAAELLKKLNIK